MFSKQVRIARCRRFNRRLRKETGNDCKKIGASKHQLRAILGCYATYRNDGNVQRGACGAQGFNSAGLRFRLGAGGEKCADLDVIHAKGRGAFRARKVVIAGNSQRQGASGLCGEGFSVAIVPAEVDSIGPDSQRHFDIIVDNQQRVAVRADFFQCAQFLAGKFCTGRFTSILDDDRAAADCGGDLIHQGFDRLVEIRSDRVKPAGRNGCSLH